MGNSTEIVRLTGKDYGELIALLNRVFSIHNKRPSDFELDLPKMCFPDDERMGKHIAVRKNGRLVAALGVYPLPIMVGKNRLMFSTVGNVATLPEEEGNGYMSALMQEAMKELDRIGADASRLGGLRQRYNRYGYETGGLLYHFSLSRYNAKTSFPNFKSDLSFVPVNRMDSEMIEKMKKLHENGKFTVDRTYGEDFYLSMIAWQNVPYAAVRSDGSLVGYLSVSKEQTDIAELAANSVKELQEMLLQWVTTITEKVSFNLMPHMISEIALMSRICQNYSISFPSLFKIIHWAEVIDAFLKLKGQYTSMPEEDMVVEIENYGTIRLTSRNQVVECIRTDAPAEITLSSLDAMRYFFGPLPSCYVSKRESPLLPLPLSWNLQDRV